MAISSKTKKILEDAYQRHHNSDFIKDDPLQIPHEFSSLQDIEIMAFFSSILAWGQRKTIINNCRKLISIFNGQPHDFILSHSSVDLKNLLGFKHRTFNDTDLLYFVAFLKHHYSTHESLEDAFVQGMSPNDEDVTGALVGFHDYFTSLEFFPSRTRKHIATPARNSACKRLNMFLRWMVRVDDQAIDFGLWTQINPSQLLCPLDVHVERQARALGLIKRKQRDFKTVIELSNNLRKIDPIDPIRFDFALFGMGIASKDPF
tara:strand:- start:136 stop:918 length:783 start_codon:yes stop_codon:yes gene_type:complete